MSSHFEDVHVSNLGRSPLPFQKPNANTNKTAWLERKLLENHEYDMTRIVGSYPERHLAMYEARLKHKESLVQYLCLRIAGKHGEAEKLYETVLALSDEVRRCSTLAWDW